MIDPQNITNYARTNAELEEFWLFSTCVAGKTASTQARLLDGCLKVLGGATPFAGIREVLADGGPDELKEMIRLSRLGQYNRLARCWEESVGLDLRTCGVEDLEAIHGVGPKTARMFLMHSRPNQRFAALDTHVLKHLRANGHPDAPAATPGSGAKYRHYEAEFLKLSDASGMNVADFDLHVWRLYAKNAN